MAGTLDGNDGRIPIFVQSLSKNVGRIVLRLSQANQIGGTVGSVGLRLEALRDEGEATKKGERLGYIDKVGVEAEVEQRTAYGFGIGAVLQDVRDGVLGVLRTHCIPGEFQFFRVVGIHRE